MKNSFRKIAFVLVGVMMLATLGSWWWVSWPSRTVNQFLEHLAADRKGEWLQMLEPPCYAPTDQQQWLKKNLTPKQRTATEILQGTQSFEILVLDPKGELVVELTVDFGRITRMEPLISSMK